MEIPLFLSNLGSRSLWLLDKGYLTAIPCLISPRTVSLASPPPCSSRSQMLRVGERHVTIRGGADYGCICVEDFLTALSKRIKPNPTCWTAFTRMHVPPGIPLELGEHTPLTALVMTKHVQNFLTPDTALISEVREWVRVGPGGVRTRIVKIPTPTPEWGLSHLISGGEGGGSGWVQGGERRRL